MRVLKLAALAVAFMVPGCASLLRFELPDELKTKKLKEDPPISQRLLCPAAPDAEVCA